MKKTFLTRLFYKGKYYKKEEKDNLTALLLPSMLGIILCAVCLMGSTWAWFTATQSTATQTIQAANYTVSAVIKQDETEIAANNGTYTLAAGTYTVTLTATGDATTGYAVVTVGKTEIYRGQLKPAETFSFTLVANEAATLEVTYQWGTAATPHSSIQDGTYTYGTAPAAEEETPNDSNNGDQDLTEPAEEATPPTDETQPTEHTVVSGDTLSSIASKYGTTVAKLAAYNNIENVNKIKIGDVIKIPPDDYVIPETTGTPQQTEEGTESSKTEDNNVPTTETEVTAPPETEGDTDASEIKT